MTATPGGETGLAARAHGDRWGKTPFKGGGGGGGGETQKFTFLDFLSHLSCLSNCVDAHCNCCATMGTF